MSKLLPTKKHAVIKLCKHILKINGDITEENFSELKQLITEHLKSGMSPADIKRHYGLSYSDFGMFIKRCLKIKLLPTKDAVNNYYRKTGQSVSNEKSIYYNSCTFTFDPYSMPGIPGYNKLLEFGAYHPTKNPNGMCRDHMISKAYGWRNKIPPEIISHPCNCQYITNAENIKKSDKSVLTIDELKERIANNKITAVNNEGRTLPKTKEHKDKIRKINSLYMLITDGKINLRILKTVPIPVGFRKGFIRKSRKI